MDIKKYLDDLYELTKTGQIKWVRRTADSIVFDCRIDDLNVISIVHDVVVNRIALIVVHGESTIGLHHLDIHGQTYKSLSKLWDEVLTVNLRKVVDNWHGVLPQVNKKIKFGPKAGALVV